MLNLGRQQGEVLGDAIDALGLDSFHVDIGEGRCGKDRGAEDREEEGRGAHFRGEIEFGVVVLDVGRAEKSRPGSREPRIPRPKGDTKMEKERERKQDPRVNQRASGVRYMLGDLERI